MKDYKEKARQVRKKVLEMIHRGGTSHIASNYSVIDIATVLYENLKEEDLVVWSKGWAAATIYYFLAKQRKIPQEDLDKFPNPPYLGLAETSVNGVWVSGGSMGHGLPIAVGMALGKKKLGQKGTIYCIMSDGEMNEGTTWESIILAAHHKLDNLIVLIDKNGWQAMGETKKVLDINIKEAFQGFKWATQEIDGHNYKRIELALSVTKFPCSECDLKGNLDDGGRFTDSYKYRMKDGICARCGGTGIFDAEEDIYEDQPKVVICDTIKGKGVSFFENHLLYHYKHVDDEEYKKALEELNGAMESV